MLLVSHIVGWRLSHASVTLPAERVKMSQAVYLFFDKLP
jgi:hypothetical protein